MQPFRPPLLHLLLLLLSVHASSSPCSFPAIFNFGDSNSDTGGFSAAFRPPRPPNGQTFAIQPAGRFSDGRLVIDFLAEGLGLPYLSAYLDSVGTNFSHGTNFATFSSTIMDQNETFSRSGYSPFSLGLQLEQFEQFKARSQLVYKRGGVFADSMPREEYFTQALYTVDIGQNDLTQWSFANKTAEDFVPQIIELFTGVIKDLRIHLKPAVGMGVEHTTMNPQRCVDIRPISMAPKSYSQRRARTFQSESYGTGFTTRKLLTDGLLSGSLLENFQTHQTLHAQFPSEEEAKAASYS